MRHHLPAPPPSPPDAAALAVVTELAEQLTAIARPLGVAVDRAYDEARALELKQGFSPRSRALQSVATANAAIWRVGEAASGRWSTETIPYRIQRAREELAAARVAVEAVKRLGRVAA